MSFQNLILLLVLIGFGVFGLLVNGKSLSSQRDSVTTEEKEILILPQKTCFRKAQELCKSQGYHLVTIENEETNKMVYDMAVSNKIGQYWIDANDVKAEGTFVNSNGERIKYKKFAKGEPNNYRNEDCIHGLYYPDGQWNDIACSTQNSVICSKEKITEDTVTNMNATYQVHTSKVTYQEALDFCQKHNCKIVTIGDETTNKIIFELARKSNIGTYWINGNDIVTEGRWVDSSGKPLRYINWYRGEPNNYQGNEDCIHGAYYHDEKWNDIDCKSRNAFIYEYQSEAIETEITIQAMKVKLSYEKAVSLCQSKGLQLVNVENDETNNIVFEYAFKNGIGTYWIDSSDLKEEKNGASGQKSKYKKFPTGVNGNLKGDDCIVGLFFGHGFWNVLKCSTEHSVICFQSKSNVGTKEVTYSGSTKYFVHVGKVTYQEAQDYCQVHNCRLITVPNAEIDKLLWQLAIKTGIDKYWLDGTDVATEGVWINSDGKKLTYLNWHEGEPNNWQKEDCLQSNFYSDGKWNDVSCLSRNSFIYEFIETVVTKTELQFFREKVTFTEAREMCANKGYSLIAIDNEETNKEVYDLAVDNQIGGYWIDANDIKVEGRFVDNEDNKIKYSKFYRGEPNNYQNEDCVMGLYFPSGYWNDISCSAKNSVICMKYRHPIISVDEHTNYNIYTQKVTHKEAQSLCKTLGYDLLQIENIEDNDMAFKLSSKYNIDSYWIDGTDSKIEGQWLFPNGETMKFLNWNTGEGVKDRNRNCVGSSQKAKGKWENVSCLSKHAAICFRDSKEIIKGGSEKEITYFIHKGKVSFKEAVSYCKKNSCQLVTIEDRDTDIRILKMVRSLNIGKYWIDGSYVKDKKIWISTEGKKLTYFNWHKGKSNTCKKHECIEVDRYNDGTWNDAACCTKNPFIYKVKVEKPKEEECIAP